MPYHPRTLVGVAISTSALLLLGIPVAAEEPPTPDDPDAVVGDPCADPVPDGEEAATGEPDGEAEPGAEEADDPAVPDGEGDDGDDPVPPDAEGDDADDPAASDAEGEDVQSDDEAVPDGEGDDGGDPAASDAEGEDPEGEVEAVPEVDDGTAGEPCPVDATGTVPTEPVPAPVPPTPVPAPEPPAPADEHVPPPVEEVSRPETPPLDDLPGDVHDLVTGYPRTPAGSTAALVEALRPLAGYGLTAGEIARVGYGRFPVGGHTTWVHDWLFPRYVPSFHPHMGIDLFADRGTPVRAPAAGTVRTSSGSIGGLAVKVVEPDGTYWYLAHLDSVVQALDGTTVDAGTIVGTVGDSGNARGGLPHVHLQLHPGGGEPVDPKPVIDDLAAEALAAVPGVLDAHRPSPVVLRALRTAFTWTAGGDDGDGAPARDPILDLLLPLARLERASEGGRGD